MDICECAVKWTPTVEECPLQSGNYLIVVNNAVEIEYFSTVIGWDCDGVTHWAPLPELPQSGEHAEKEDKELLVEKIRKLQTYKLAPELEKLVSLEKVIAILEGEENVF